MAAVLCGSKSILRRKCHLTCEELIRPRLLAQPRQHLMRSNSSSTSNLQPGCLQTHKSPWPQMHLRQRAFHSPSVLSDRLLTSPTLRQQAQAATLMSLCLLPERRSTLSYKLWDFLLGLISNLHSVESLGSSRMGEEGLSEEEIHYKNHFPGNKDSSMCLSFLSLSFFLFCIAEDGTQGLICVK